MQYTAERAAAAQAQPTAQSGRRRSMSSRRSTPPAPPRPPFPPRQFALRVGALNAAALANSSSSSSSGSRHSPTELHHRKCTMRNAFWWRWGWRWGWRWRGLLSFIFYIYILYMAYRDRDRAGQTAQAVDGRCTQHTAHIKGKGARTAHSRRPHPHPGGAARAQRPAASCQRPAERRARGSGS
jgi:hypothetical protein